MIKTRVVIPCYWLWYLYYGNYWSRKRCLMMFTQHSVIINNYRMIKRLSPTHDQVIVYMIPANQRVLKWSSPTIVSAVQCWKFGTEYQRSMKSAQIFYGLFSIQQVEVFKTLNFGLVKMPKRNTPPGTDPECSRSHYILVLSTSYLAVHSIYVLDFCHCYLP
jgi:hypothetical protein